MYVALIFLPSFPILHSDCFPQHNILITFVPSQSLDGHHNAITCVKFDDHHIITGSMDGYAMAWNTIGRHKKCLQAFRHPK